MRRRDCHRLFRVRFRRAEVFLMVILKIKHFVGVHAAVTQLADDLYRHSPQIFTNYHAVMTFTFQRQN